MEVFKKNRAGQRDVVIFNIRLFALSMLILMTGCDSGSIVNTNDPDPDISDKSTATISLGPTVDVAIKERITEYSGLLANASADGDVVLPMPEEAHSVVFAMNEHGEPLLAAMVAPGTHSTLDARSSALLLVRFVADASVIIPGEAAELEKRIANLSGFQTLVDSIGARAARNLSLTNTDESLEEAFTLAQGLVNHNEMENSVMVLQFSENQNYSTTLFKTFSYVQADGAPNREITITNALFVPIKLVSSKSSLPIRVGSANFCPTCWPWDMYSKGDNSFKLTEDGPFDLSVELDHQAVVMQSVLDLLGLAFGKVYDKPIKDMFKKDNTIIAELVLGQLSAQITTLDAALRGQGFQDAGMVIYQWGIKHSEVIAGVIIKLFPNMKEKALVNALMNVMPGVGQALKGVELAKMGLSFATAFKYWDSEAENVIWCIEDEQLYGGCSDRVEIDPKETTLEYNEKAKLTATVYDSEGRILKDKRVKWSTDHSDLVEMQHGTSITTDVTAREKVGVALITAKSGNTEGEVLIKIKDIGLFGLWAIDGSIEDVYSITSIDGYSTIGMLYFEGFDERCFVHDKADLLYRLPDNGYFYETNDWGWYGDTSARVEFIKVNDDKFKVTLKLKDLKKGSVRNVTFDLDKTDSLPSVCR